MDTIGTPLGQLRDVLILEVVCTKQDSRTGMALELGWLSNWDGPRTGMALELGWLSNWDGSRSGMAVELGWRNSLSQMSQ